MATLFDRKFEAITEESPGYDLDGSYVPGELSVRTVRGTIQPITGNETIPAKAASRNTGTVKIYSTERLAFRNRDGDSRGYVRKAGALYEIVDELPNTNDLINHWKYVACLVSDTEMPEGLK